MMVLLLCGAANAKAKGSPNRGKPMGRIFTSGFESQREIDFSAETEWAIGPGASGAIDTDVVHGGKCSLRFDSSGTCFAESDDWPLFAAADMTEIYARFYFRVAANQGASVAFWGLSGNTGSNQDRPLLRLNSDGTVRAAVIDEFGVETNLGSGTAVLSPGEWYRIELHWKTGSGNGILEVRVDGVDDISITTADFDDPLQRFIVQRGGGATGDFWFDDVAVNDPSGTVNNSWPGPGFVEWVNMTGDDATGNWSSTAASFFSTLDDLPGTLSDADYVFTTSNAANNELRFTAQDLPTEYQLDAKVNVIHIGWRIVRVAQTVTCKTQLRDADNNTLDGFDQSIGTLFDSFTTVYPTLTAEQTFGGSPVDMTVEYANAVRAALVETNTNTREMRCSLFWATIEVQDPPTYSFMHGFQGVFTPLEAAKR